MLHKANAGEEGSRDVTRHRQAPVLQTGWGHCWSPRAGHVLGGILLAKKGLRAGGCPLSDVGNALHILIVMVSVK